MALIKRCCFFSLRKGSYLSAFYTLIFYTIIFMAGTINIHSMQNDFYVFVSVLCLMIMSALTIVTSIIMVLGISGENVSLLLPWMATISILTVLEVFIIIFMMVRSVKGTNSDPFMLAMVIADVIIVSANIYGLVCVVSLFIEIRRKRNSQSHDDTRLYKRPNQMEIPCKDNEELSKEYLLTSSPQRLPVSSQTEEDNKSSTSFLSIK
ncbi:uncharacterized protein LOC107364019 [Tetranychus urticae]|uniref:DUF7027 domain-containing protein n=1 Tax=Tetranychus urticae TaxID=32264 RepID=T1KH85_TETUR|nr:uncharacterized protein LOC107364019 [Tetranychus urticae]